MQRINTLMISICIAGCLLPATSFAGEKLVIAHRGASGYLPEHTLEAYSMAYAQGADYIEPDLVLTKDNVFICLHDIHLEGTTDIEQKFPDRHREDMRWYAVDFTLEEIKTLRVHERLEHRFPHLTSKFEVPTFVEMIELIQGLNKQTRRDVGIYPEIKATAWHTEEGHASEKRLLDTLTKYGYTDTDSKVYVQCFEPHSLRKIRNEYGSKLKLIQLISDVDEHAELRTKQGIGNIAVYADGIGPYKGDIEINPALVTWAHRNGLAVHPYTFRADDVPEHYPSFKQELIKFYRKYKVDGVFTDFPDQVADYLGR